MNTGLHIQLRLFFSSADTERRHLSCTWVLVCWSQSIWVFRKKLQRLSLYDLGGDIAILSFSLLHHILDFPLSNFGQARSCPDWEFPQSPFSRIMRLQAKIGISCLLPCSSDFISYRYSVMQLCLHCTMNPVRREQDRQYACDVKWRRLRLKNLQWKANNVFCVCCCWVTCHSQLHKNIDFCTTTFLP
jgi:hypothetical protein